MNNPDIVDKLNDPNTSDEDRQIYQNQILQAVNKKLGIQIAQDVKVISTDEPGQGGKQVAGFITKENDTIYSNDKNQKTSEDAMYALGQEIAGSYQKSQGIDITTNRDQHNNYQNMVAQNTIDDISFLSNNYNLGVNLNTVNNHNTNTNQVTSTPSIFNSQTSNNNAEFAGLDKENGDNSSLEFDRSDSKVYIKDKNGKSLGSYPATNIADSRSAGKWTNGKYKYDYYKPHPESDKNGIYGSNGIFVFKTPSLKRTGMGIHSGRADKNGYKHATNGCVRTTDTCSARIKKVHKSDPLTSMTIRD